ncbi:hypothetical protein [Lentzea guizhouensis]|uniref:hypothetical protein n=1 Tax=Lentzea guizhouensis TaxID=1586287 RepID=UPI0012B6974E|nr:hypothetical protein [Lentzea guizhouensis]
MTDTQTTPAVTTPDRPLGLVSLAQVDVPYSYGIVKVAQLGVEADEEFSVFTADPDLAIRAVDHVIREHYAAIPDEIVLADEAQPVHWRQLYNHCGCVEHQLDDDGAHLCRCKREGMPPCVDDDQDYYTWQMEPADKDDLDATPVVLVSTEFHFPASTDDGVQLELVVSPSNRLEVGGPLNGSHTASPKSSDHRR